MTLVIDAAAMAIAAQRIGRARLGLALDCRFYGSLICRVDAQITEDIPTAATNGKVHMFNPAFVAEQGGEELEGLCYHEVEHDALHHATRRFGREPMLWNVAGDHVINLRALADGRKLPKGGLADPRFAGMCTEDVYRTLKGERAGQPMHTVPLGMPGAGGQTHATPGEMATVMKCGAVFDAPGSDENGEGESARAQEAEAEKALHVAIMVAKGCGQLPGSWSLGIESLRQSKRDWRDELRQFCEASGCEKVSTWSRPNRRYSGEGMYMPSLRPYGVGKVAAVVDTSGSMTAETKANLESIGDELQALLDDGIIGELVVVAGDTMVRETQTFRSGERVALSTMGGGGTDMNPLFQHVADCEPDASLIVCFTDLIWGGYMPPKPAQPVLFAVYGNPAAVAGRIAAAPWGAKAFDVGR